jgi:hypothetical protein
MKTYELTVYHNVNNHGYSILEKTFTSASEMLTYCSDFDTDNNDLLFDVWTEEDGQFNINEAVRRVRAER